MATKKAYGMFGSMTPGAPQQSALPTAPKVGQPKKAPKPAVPSMTGGPSGLRSRTPGGSANAATGSTKVARIKWATATPGDVASFLTKFAFGGGMPNRGSVPKTGGGPSAMGAAPPPKPMGGAGGPVGRTGPGGAGGPGAGGLGNIMGQEMSMLPPLPKPPVADLAGPGPGLDMGTMSEMQIPDIQLSDQQAPKPSLLDSLPPKKDLMQPVREPMPTPGNHNRFMGQAAADQHWGTNYAKDPAATYGKAQSAVAQRGYSPRNPARFSPGGGPLPVPDPNAGFPVGGGAGPPPVPPPQPPALAAGLGKQGAARKSLDLTDPMQFGKAAAMGCKVVNHTRGKMEKRATGMMARIQGHVKKAFGAGTLIGAIGGGMTAPKGHRMEGVGRGGARGAGWDIGGSLGGSLGGITGAGLGGLGGGALAVAMAKNEPGTKQEDLAKLLHGLTTLGAGFGGAVGGLGGYAGGGYLGQRVAKDMLGDPTYAKKKNNVPDKAQ